MAKTEKEEVIFEFKIEQGDALTEAERLKKLIIQTKQEQQELNKAYKAGSITLDEYVADNVRLEANLKRQQSSYNNVQKSVTGVKTQLDKLIDSNKKISKSFDDTAKSINVAGINVGDLTTKVASFANPATAAVGVVTALGAAYLNSSTGARDFAQAQEQLRVATQLASNSFGEFIDRVTGGSGTGQDGILSFISSAIIARFDFTAAAIGRIAALSKRELQELEISDLEAKREAKRQLDLAEVSRRARDDQEKSLQDRLIAAREVATFIDERERQLVTVQEDVLKQLQILLATDKENLELKKQIKQVEFEIADIREDSQGKRTEALNAELDLERQIAEQRLINARAANADLSARPIGELATSTTKKPDSSIVSGTLATIDSQKAAADQLAKINQDIQKANLDTGESYRKKAQVAQVSAGQEIQAAASVATALSGIFEEGSEMQRLFALIGIGTDTAEAISALTAASEGNPANAFTFGGAGALQFAAGLARIFGNIALAKRYLSGAAAGGGDFITKGPTMLMVGDNPGGRERVTVEPLSGKGKTQIYNPNLIAMAGGGSLLAGDPGGLNTNSLTTETNQNVAMANMIKRMPRPVVSVKEVTKVSRRISVRENLGRSV